MGKIIGEIQEASNLGDSRKLFSLIRQAYGPRSSSVTPIRSKDRSRLIKDPAGIIGRWQEHFDDLLNRESIINPSFIDKIQQRDIVWAMNERPTLDELNDAIDSLNLGKAPGKYGIAPEMLRYGGEYTRKVVWEIIGGFWDDESVHQDWRDTIMIILYKSKGKRDLCGNYRGIALLCVVGKVLSRIMLSRLTTHVADKVLQESQCGFRAGRGTADMIFSARQIQEKCREQRIGLYQVFIDLTKAFDTVNRTALWQILRKLGCPDKYTNILKLFHDDMKVWVSLSGELSDPISVENGVKQGDIPAPTLFALYFYIVFLIAFDNDDAPAIYIRYRTSNKLFDMRRFRAKSKLMISAIRDLLYADDCDLVTHTEADMQKMLDLFSSACSDLGLTISLDKTKAMFSPAPGEVYVEPNLFVYGKRLSVVLEFIYLGSKLHQSCSLDQETAYRISRASASFANLHDRCWSRRGISPKTKIGIYETVVLPSLTAALETSTLHSRNLAKLDSFQQYCLREILNIRWQSRTTNEDVLARAGCVSITSLLMKSRLRWSGHVVRMPDSRLPKQLLYGELCLGSRAFCGQALRFKDTLRVTLKKCKIGDTWETMACDRVAWRKLVYESVDSFEKGRIEHAGLKRAVRKGQPHALIASSNTITCPICHRILLCRAGYISQMRMHERHTQVQTTTLANTVHLHYVIKCQTPKCRRAGRLMTPQNIRTPILQLHDTMHCDTPRCRSIRSKIIRHQCPDCGKICKSKGGLTLHRKVHNK